MTQVKVEPGKVLVVGPSKVLQDIDTLFTEPISLDGITESGKISANIVFSPSTIRPDDQKKAVSNWNIQWRNEKIPHPEK